jgi:hypothetical protein
MLPPPDGSLDGGVTVKRLRCVLVGHRWTRRRIEGETTLECRRCGRIADARDAASASANLLGG